MNENPDFISYDIGNVTEKHVVFNTSGTMSNEMVWSMMSTGDSVDSVRSTSLLSPFSDDLASLIDNVAHTHTHIFSLRPLFWGCFVLRPSLSIPQPISKRKRGMEKVENKEQKDGLNHADQFFSFILRALSRILQ